MREILFRAKQHYTKEWLYGAVVKDENECLITVGEPDGLYKQKMTVVEESTVGQFTGFTDKNGNKIFEGDILYIEDDDGNKYVTQVWYERGGLVIDVKGCDYDYTVIGWLEYYYSMEVIGNIHDNLESLKEQK